MSSENEWVRELESAGTDLARMLVADGLFTPRQAEAIAVCIVGAITPAYQRMTQTMWLGLLVLLDDGSPRDARTALDLVLVISVARKMLLAEWRESAPASMVELVDLARAGKHEGIRAWLQRWRAEKEGADVDAT